MSDTTSVEEPRLPSATATDALESSDDVLAGGGEMGARLRAIDWAATPLGPPSTWPTSLRSALSICLGSRFPIALYWGPQFALLYNDAWSPILGAKHPWALGRPGSEVWPELWDTIGPMYESARSTGEAVYAEDELLVMERHGYAEEGYFNYTLSPIRGVGGTIDGVFNAVIETTFRVLAERRNRVLRELGAQTTGARTPDEACVRAAEALRAARHDAPFCVLYLVDEVTGLARRVASAGLPEGSPVAPDAIALRGDDASRERSWPLGSVADRIEVVSKLTERFGVTIASGPWPEPCEAAMIAPFRLVGASTPAGFLILGVSPRRAVDDEYLLFADRATSLVGAAVASAVAFEVERKRAEALAAIDRAKTEFFSNVSHEFRTPLTLLLGPIEETLGDPSLGPQHRALLTTADHNARRLLKLVNTLLDFTRIEADRADAHYEPTDLGPLTADLASSFRSAAQKAGLRFEIDTPSNSEAVRVDRGMWEKIVLNLLSNALKHTFEGAISVTTRQHDGRFELRVRDTGVGIPAEEVPRLFERFHRVRGARSRTHEGTGIGLALVQQLVALHGGTIDVASVVGEGTTFTVSIPTGAAQGASVRVADESAKPKSSERASAFVHEALGWLTSDAQREDAAPVRSDHAAETSVASARIVLADDNADMRAYIARLLREQGWQVHAVGDGHAALEATRKQIPDMVLSDVMMPGLDGFGLLRALREDAATRTIPVVLLSARAGSESIAEGLRAGADDYIVKPFVARDLLVRLTARLAMARAAREAREQRANLYRHFMQAPFPIVIYRGPTHVIDLANDAALRAWGRDASVVGRPFDAALVESRDPSLAAHLDRVFSTGTALEARAEFTPMRDRYFEFVYAPLFDENGRVEGVLSCGFDVTEQTLSHQRVERAHLEAERANQLKDEFLATMSHELRTPLNAILGWARMLRTGALAPQVRERAFESIERNATAQVALVEDVLDVSRIVAGKLRLTVEPIELTSVVEAAVDTVRPAADAKGVRLQLLLDTDAGMTMGDPNRLQQVIWNLVSNAVKFTPRDGRVHVRLEREHSAAQITIEDTGQGIPTDFLPHVFERFRQADATMTRQHGGLGLGLSIVKSLVELHGGTVRAHSEGVDRGATFVVRIPIVPMRETAPAEAYVTPTPPEVTVAFPCPPIIDGLRVLLVDDDPDAREVLVAALERCNARVASADSAQQAFAMFRESPPDVLVSDIGMPGEDGYALIRRVRALSVEEGGRIPAIALTAYARAQDRARALSEGFTNHVAKPIDPQDLVASVAAVASVSGARRADA